jgi:hypothetical protein
MLRQSEDLQKKRPIKTSFTHFQSHKNLLHPHYAQNTWSRIAKNLSKKKDSEMKLDIKKRPSSTNTLQNSLKSVQTIKLPHSDRKIKKNTKRLEDEVIDSDNDDVEAMDFFPERLRNTPITQFTDFSPLYPDELKNNGNKKRRSLSAHNIRKPVTIFPSRLPESQTVQVAVPKLRSDKAWNFPYESTVNHIIPMTKLVNIKSPYIPSDTPVIVDANGKPLNPQLLSTVNDSKKAVHSNNLKVFIPMSKVSSSTPLPTNISTVELLYGMGGNLSKIGLVNEDYKKSKTKSSKLSVKNSLKNMFHSSFRESLDTTFKLQKTDLNSDASVNNLNNLVVKKDEKNTKELVENKKIEVKTQMEKMNVIDENIGDNIVVKPVNTVGSKINKKGKLIKRYHK